MEQLPIIWQEAAIQPRELRRVRAAIAGLILEFFEVRGIGAQFHMAELMRFVNSHMIIAPDSAGRILRDMRQDGELNYAVIDRRKSLYRIEAV